MLSDVTALVARASAVVERASVKPPSGNTGVHLTGSRLRLRPDDGVGVSLGWLSCTWVGTWDTPEEFAAWALVFLGELVPSTRRSWRGYDIVREGAHGVLLGARYRDGGCLELHLDVPAVPLEALSLDALHAFLHMVLHAQNVSRIDLTLDDWQKVMSPAQLDALTSGAEDAYSLNKSQLVTRAKDSSFIRSKSKTGGDTWYLGASSGEARLRVYDKFRESSGEIDAIRWELQLRDKRAKDALTCLMGEAIGNNKMVADVMGDVISSQLVRFVDFRDRSADSNSSRCPRLDWFVCLVLDAKKARPVYVPAPLTVEAMHDYAESALPSWLATLADSAALVCGVTPEMWLLAYLEQGRSKRSPRHEMALRSAGISAPGMERAA